MSAPYKIAAAARADLVDIYEYTAEHWGLEQADRYQALLTERFANIAEHPLIGVARPSLRKGLRCYPVESHVIYYWLQRGEVEFVRILHNRQDSRTAFARR